jgi:hypothetical protein
MGSLRVNDGWIQGKTLAAAAQSPGAGSTAESECRNFPGIYRKGTKPYNSDSIVGLALTRSPEIGEARRPVSGPAAAPAAGLVSSAVSAAALGTS